MYSTVARKFETYSMLYFQILQDFAFQRGQFADNDHDVDYETMRYVLSNSLKKGLRNLDFLSMLRVIDQLCHINYM